MVRLGFIVVYLGFGYGLLALWFAVGRLAPKEADTARADTATAPAAARVAAGGAAASVAGFWLPAISGFPEGTINSWEGLDPISTATCTVIASLLVVYSVRPRAGGDVRCQIVASLAASLAALVAGNVLIQSFTDRGTEPEWGLFATGLASLVTLVGGLVALRRPDVTGMRGEE